MCLLATNAFSDSGNVSLSSDESLWNNLVWNIYVEHKKTPDSKKKSHIVLSADDCVTLLMEPYQFLVTIPAADSGDNEGDYKNPHSCI